MVKAPLSALRRELGEEIRLVLAENDARHLGCYSAPAANEPGYTVEAEIFHVRMRHDPATQSEIEETVWVDYVRGGGVAPGTFNPRPHSAAVSCATIRFSNAPWLIERSG